MDLSSAFDTIVAERRSIRTFTDQAVPQALIEHIFSSALRAPSNCNTQPWYAHVVTGPLLEQLRETMPAKFAAGEMELDYPYDGRYDGVFKERQHGAAKALYDALGIPREDKARRAEWFMDNFRFFGAPACAFFTLPAEFGLREACDLGMFAQTVMLGLTAHGLGSCPQTSLGFMTNVVRPALNLPDDQKLMFGLSFGYPSASAINEVRTDRAAMADAVFLHS